MNKTELVGEISAKSGLTKKDTEKIINAFFDTVEEVLKTGNKVQLMGFGTFEVRQRQARKGRNPQTGEEINIPETVVPAFKAGKALKDLLQ
jgi:DNA-binding protein HU-beta